MLDQLEIQETLLHLEDLKTEGHSTIKGPHFLKVLCLDGFFIMVLLYQGFFFFFFSFQFNLGIFFEGMINWDLSVLVAIHEDKSQLFNPWVI